MNERIELSVVTPEGEKASAQCDSVRLVAADGTDGKNGGGIGIHRGHASAMIALADSCVTALLEGQVILKVEIKSGFAAVNKDKIVVLTDYAKVV